MPSFNALMHLPNDLPALGRKVEPPKGKLSNKYEGWMLMHRPHLWLHQPTGHMTYEPPEPSEEKEQPKKEPRHYEIERLIDWLVTNAKAPSATGAYDLIKQYAEDPSWNIRIPGEPAPTGKVNEVVYWDMSFFKDRPYGKLQQPYKFTSTSPGYLCWTDYSRGKTKDDGCCRVLFYR